MKDEEFYKIMEPILHAEAEKLGYLQRKLNNGQLVAGSYMREFRGWFICLWSTLENYNDVYGGLFNFSMSVNSVPSSGRLPSVFSKKSTKLRSLFSKNIWQFLSEEKKKEVVSINGYIKRRIVLPEKTEKPFTENGEFLEYLYESYKKRSSPEYLNSVNESNVWLFYLDASVV